MHDGFGISQTPSEIPSPPPPMEKESVLARGKEMRICDGIRIGVGSVHLASMKMSFFSDQRWTIRSVS